MLERLSPWWPRAVFCFAVLLFASCATPIEIPNTYDAGLQADRGAPLPEDKRDAGQGGFDLAPPSPPQPDLDGTLHWDDLRASGDGSMADAAADASADAEPSDALPADGATDGAADDATSDAIPGDAGPG